MARYGNIVAGASSLGFGADGIMVLSLLQGPFRAFGGFIQLLALALQLDLDPVEAPAARADGGVSPPVPRHVKRAEDYLVRHLAEPLTVVELAARVGVSVRSLHRGFLDFRGVTPARYLQNLRIEAAHRLLTSSDCFLDLRQVATEVGFGSYAPFWRAYVRKYGRAPSSTRRFNGDAGLPLNQSLA
ncbi:helix-turn-helix domain-containing protein [Oleomonas cavernae]|nr:AraC family transcriptional regulator [Oleomonas cavernae]